jgi:prophage regulatory protein
MAVRKAMRMPALMEALGKCKSQIYDDIKAGKIPAGTPIGYGRAVVWWEDEIEAIQKAAVERAAAKGRAWTPPGARSEPAAA